MARGEPGDYHFRNWYYEFIESPVKLSEPVFELGGQTLIVCDGTKHRKLISGVCDLLVSITPCDHPCETWKKTKGEAVRDIVPNLSEEWFLSQTDVDNTGVVEDLM